MACVRRIYFCVRCSAFPVHRCGGSVGHTLVDTLPGGGPTTTRRLCCVSLSVPAAWELLLPADVMGTGFTRGPTAIAQLRAGQLEPQPCIASGSWRWTPGISMLAGRSLEASLLGLRTVCLLSPGPHMVVFLCLRRLRYLLLL